MDNEERIKCILNIASNSEVQFIDNDLDESSNIDITGLNNIQDFLQTKDCISICAYIQKDEVKIKLVFVKEVFTEVFNKLVIIYKNQSVEISKENFKSTVQILSIIGSPITSLYSAINNVFMPLIQNKQHFKYSDIKKKISNLNEELRYAILTVDSDSNNLLSTDHNFSGLVLSLEHEVDYWNKHAKFATDEHTQRSCESFSKILKPLSQHFTVLDTLPFGDVEDVLENAHNILDDLWRYEPPFPKSRVIHLIDLIASNIIAYIEKHMQSIDIWFTDYSRLSEVIVQCKSLGELWITICTQLTKIFWPNFSLNPWIGVPYLPQSLCNVIKRMDDILNVRTIHRQLTRLLSSSEQKDLKTNEMFVPFTELDILNCKPQNENAWLKANKQYEHLLKPTEEKVALKLKQQLSNVKNNTRQLLYEFTRYSELIERPVVKQMLENERRSLLNELHNYVADLNNHKSEISLRTTKYDFSQVVGDVFSSKLLEVKVTEVQMTSQKLLRDLSGYEGLIQNVLALLNDVKQQTTEYFNTWTSEITLQIPNLSLQESDPVVNFSSNKMMRVNYSPRLVTLLAEVRQLSALGYKIPAKIEQLSEHAKHFINYAKTLEQIANFHNTIGDRMINSQKPIMLVSALELSKLVQEQKAVPWNDTQSVHVYVNKLKSAVEKLSKQNNMLANYHYKIIEKMKEVEYVDLIKDYGKWQEVSKYIREIMSEVEEKGFTNLDMWKNDIDKMLSFYLEKQYLKCLDTVHLYLPEIYTDLVYHNSQLQFSPNEVVLRNKYEQQLKVFVEIPKQFRGVSSMYSHMFSQIMERNFDKLNNLNTHTDSIFNQLRDVVKHWQSWLSLDNLEKSQLTSWEHWDLHFRASKNFGQEIAKLPSTEEKVGCFIIGLSRLRTDLEFHNKSYWDQLVSMLKDSIAVDVVKLQDYINTSISTLTKQPVTLEQLSEADCFYTMVLKQLTEMEKCYEEMLRRANILSSWTKEKIDSVNRLQGAWERLHHLIDNHQHTMEKQLETIKITLNISSENIINEIERFIAKWEEVNSRPSSGQISTDSFEQLKIHSEIIKDKHKQWRELMEKREKLLTDYEKFNITQIEFPSFHEIEGNLEKQVKLWAIFDEFYSGLENISEEDWIVFRNKMYQLQEFLNEWEEKLNKINSTVLTTRLLQEIHKYQEVAQFLKYVKGDDFTEKHWLEVFTLLHMETKLIDNLKLKDFLNVSETLINHVDDLQIICKKAVNEIVVRQALLELEQWEIQTRFELILHMDSQKNGINVIKDYKEVLNKIGDNQSLLQSVKNCINYDSFTEITEMWETKLADLEQNISLLAQIQRKWVYLEPIFGHGTLDKDKSRFDKLDKDFRHVLSFIQKNTKVISLCHFTNLHSVLKNIQDQLSRCQNSLDNFLIEKRRIFPRFLFLADDDLLEVLGQSSKEQVIQSHLKKLFSGINSIKLDENNKFIDAICSSFGETISLKNKVPINKPVEEWLNILVGEMRSSLKEILCQCLVEENDLNPLKYPSQILCLADNIIFTEKCEKAITNMTLPPLLTNYKAHLNHYKSLELVRNDSSTWQDSNEDSMVLESKLKALLLDSIHHISVIEELINTNVTKLTDWDWQKQLRYYWNTKGEVEIRMLNAKFEYSFEYLGNTQKLVRTPLTDQCFLTLTQAMHIGLGGNPYGPAGTGKTETVKALGCLLGRQVLVFNCDAGIDAISMGRILTGLVKTGAWGCFDEFNRLDEATLSAVSMFIQPIQISLQNQTDTLTLLGQEINLNKHCGIFITLNPAGENYGGRNKLPDNLKQLFRPVVMSHPDHELIAKTLLHSDGFKNGEIIGSKLIEIFNTASQLLSKQFHYDWGLRAIKTVLNGCGKSLKLYRRKNNGEVTLSTEIKIAVHVLKIDTLSKLTYHDSIKFNFLIKDVFNDVPDKLEENDTLLHDLETAYTDLGLVFNNRQANKCIELFEQLKQRIGVAIVGPPGSGKSTIRNVLFNALIKSGKKVEQHIISPKSMPRNQFLGQIDKDTRQWSDGVLTLCSLNVTSKPNYIWSWILCDGDVDPDWVESLNSVLDDNHLLTLPSGWRIQFGQNVNFIFETDDLSFCSPATISRIGIVFLSEEDLNLNDYVCNIIRKTETSSILGDVMPEYILKGTDWAFKNCEFSLPRSKISVINTVLSVIMDSKTKTDFMISMANGFGYQLLQRFNEQFAQEIFEWTNEMLPLNVSTAQYHLSRDILDAEASITNLDISKGLPLIITAQVHQTLTVLNKWIKSDSEKHFLLVGPHGSAKTLILEHLIIEELDGDIITIYCSSHINPSYIIYKLSQHCIIVNSNVGKIYKAKKNFLLLHFKGLHLLKNDKWGTNMLISFLQQIITYKGFYDSTLEWVGVQNIILAGTLESTQSLSKRFTSLLHLYNIELPEQNDLNVIFNLYISTIIKKQFINYSWPQFKVEKMLNTMITIFKEIEATFLSADQLHYKISLHELSEWCKGLARYQNVIDNDFEHTLLEAVTYEAINIFGNKLVHENEKIKLLQIINHNVELQWNIVNITKVMDYFFVPVLNSTNELTTGNLFKLNTDDWTDVIKKGIQQYEREAQNLNIIVIPELLNLTATVSKVLSVPNSNILLIGRAGVGRRSALKIVSALHHASLITPFSNEQPHLNNELKMALQQAGIEEKQTYLLYEDHMFHNNNYATNIINTLLHSGEVPELYNLQELDTLTSGLKDKASDENFNGSLNEYFTYRILKNLHFIICIESENIYHLNMFNKYPVLYQKCSIVWKDSWSNETINKLPKMFIEELNNKNENDKIEVSDGFYDIYDVIKQEQPAPTQYINLIDLYTQIYLEKKHMIAIKQNQLQIGVSKLTEARGTVSSLKAEATEQKEKLAEKQLQSNSALDMISNTMKNTNIHKEQMEKLKQKTEQENEQLIKRKKEIDLELASVEPLILQAKTAVGDIKTESLSEIRSLRAPPDIIRDILEGVLRLMGIQDTSWNSMKIFLAKRGVKEDIRTFDASKIIVDNRQAVERLIATKSDSFDPKSAKRASVAAAPLAAWVKANVKYSQVVEKIKPLEKEQNILQQNLNNATGQLNALSDGLLGVDATVAQLKVQLSTYTKEAAEIEIQLNNAQDKLLTAQELVEKLNDEYERWKIQLRNIDEDFETLPKFCLLSSAFITYLPKESEDKRSNILKEWSNRLLKKNVNFTMEKFLSTERDISRWKSEGLSVDQLSIQNAIIILRTKIKVLIIDPTSVAIKWLREHLKKKKLAITTQNSENFISSLEFAIRFGKIVLIEEVENISSILLSILRNNYIEDGARKLLFWNGKFIDLHSDFQLILCSRNEKLKLTTDISSLICTINFSITHAGLAEQLLTSTICYKNPTMEERKRQLLQERENLQTKLYELQDQLLEDLASSFGDIIQNKSLITSLNETKKSSSAIKKALEESVEVENKLQVNYNTYRNITSFGSCLYFAAIEICRKNVLNLFSVPSFIRLFLKTVSTFEDSQGNYDSQQRLLLQSVYQFTSRSLFKKDRMKLALYLTLKVFPDQIKEQEWNFFLGNSLAGAKREVMQEELPNWIPEQCSQNIYTLKAMLPELYNELKLNEESLWKNFMNKCDCELHFPARCKISEFQKVIVVQTLRSDKLYAAMSLCVLHLTGLKNLDSDILHLSQMFKESTAEEPILLVTTSGNDPSIEIQELARREIKNENYMEISMGEGQEHLAIDTLKQAVKYGHWLVLKNLHLVITWLPVLCQHLQTLEIHQNFRLWLVTQYSSKFNTVLAQNSLKLAYETPEGVRNNLQRMYSAWSEKKMKMSLTSARIFFVLSCVHVLLKERLTFIPQGWSKLYEFNDTDFDTAIKLINDFWHMDANKIQWKYLSEICYKVVYGGKVENFEDLKVLKSYFTQYLSEGVLSHRWRPFNLDFGLPNSDNFTDYIQILSQLPNRNRPGYFGLPENINRAWEKNMSLSVIKSVKDLHLTEHTDLEFDKEIWIKSFSPLMNVWKKTNQGYNFIRMDIPDIQISNKPIIDFIREEHRYGVVLLQYIHKSFTNLNKIMKGVQTPTENDISFANSLLIAKTPQTWQVEWYGPEDPIKYIKAAVSKVKFIFNWIEEQNVEKFLRQPLKMSFFFNPCAFLASYKQYFSRINNCTLDSVTLHSVWRQPTNAQSVTLTGLLLEGAMFKNYVLTPCAASSENINSAPDCFLNWKEKEGFIQCKEILEVPVYFTSNRKKVFILLQIPCNYKEKDKWIQAGLAFYIDY